LIGFLQGSPGSLEVVGDRITAPPATFHLIVPKRWLQPKQLLVKWDRPSSAVGGITYSVLLDGRPVGEGIVARQFRPGAALLGNGKRQLQVMATDGLGGQVLSGSRLVRVDGEPPQASLKVAAGHGRVTVQVSDGGSGVLARKTRISFGDGESARHGVTFHHAYEKPGAYTVTVSARDRVGNRMRTKFPVQVR
jgi:hypothetical protein